MLTRILKKLGKKETVHEFKERLEKDKAKLTIDLDNVKAPDSDEFAPLPSFGDGDDLSIEADQVEEIGNALAVKDVLERKLIKIDSALERIKKGEYGICESCGKEIELRRLRVEPAATLCTKCVKKMTGQGKK
jgi:DnaK suppressor protein